MSAKMGYNTMPCDAISSVEFFFSLFQWQKTNVSWIKNHTEILLLTKHEADKKPKYVKIARVEHFSILCIVQYLNIKIFHFRFIKSYCEYVIFALLDYSWILRNALIQNAQQKNKNIWTKTHHKTFSPMAHHFDWWCRTCGKLGSLQFVASEEKFNVSADNRRGITSSRLKPNQVERHKKKMRSKSIILVQINFPTLVLWSVTSRWITLMCNDIITAITPCIAIFAILYVILLIRVHRSMGAVVTVVEHTYVCSYNMYNTVE